MARGLGLHERIVGHTIIPVRGTVKGIVMPGACLVAGLSFFLIEE